MKKKYIILIILAILLVLNFPIRYELKDGCTIMYKSLLWSYSKVHSINEESGFNVGTRFKILGITVKEDIHQEPRRSAGDDNNVVDEHYDHDTAFSLENTSWQIEGLKKEYQFGKANIKNDLTELSCGSETKGAYYLYTEGPEFDQFQDLFKNSQENLKNLYAEQTEGMSGIPFGLCIDLDIKGNPDTETGQQSMFEYYGMYTEDKIVMVEVGSYDDIYKLVKNKQ